MSPADREPPADRPVVEVRDATKWFGPTLALDRVTVDLARGEVHGLVGENGAGKSTLGRVIGGVHPLDDGAILLDGQPVGRWDQRRALAAGIAVIAQEPSLVPDITVARNVFLGQERHTFGLLRRDLLDRFAALEERCGLGLDPRARVGDLRLADQQKVEIMRALSRDARVIVMDEPASSLTADETGRLHELIAWLRSHDRTVVYATHFLDHVLAHCDRISVLRDGRLVRTGHAAGETKHRLVEAMLGRPLEVVYPPLPAPPAPDAAPALEVRDVHTDTGVCGISLQVRPGEIVGLAGLVGSGRTETLRAIFGADPVRSGEVLADGQPLRSRRRRAAHTVGDAIRAGMALVPEDRHGEGLVLSARVRPNVTLPHLRRFLTGGLVSAARERRAVADLLERLDVVPRHPDAGVATLSGGNQQKVLLARWMVDRRRIVLLDEPTRGVDVGAKARIYRAITELARAGTAVLLVSSEHEEVMGLSHRVYLMAGGRVAGTADPAATSVEELLFRLFNLTTTGEVTEPR